MEMIIKIAHFFLIFLPLYNSGTIVPFIHFYKTMTSFLLHKTQQMSLFDSDTLSVNSLHNTADDGNISMNGSRRSKQRKRFCAKGSLLIGPGKV